MMHYFFLPILTMFFKGFHLGDVSINTDDVQYVSWKDWGKRRISLVSDEIKLFNSLSRGSYC